VEVREGVIMSPCSIPPESITVWEVEDVNGVMDQVKQGVLQEIGYVALIATESSMPNMVMVNVENAEVAANARIVVEMVTNRNPCNY